MFAQRPRIMKHPGRGARAQYRTEYKRWLDIHYRVGAIRQRCDIARACVSALSAALAQVESRLYRKGFAPEELHMHIRECDARVAKLERTAPKPPPIRSWSAMRSLEMKAYRKQLRAFDKWDDKMCAFMRNSTVLLKVLNKLTPVKTNIKQVYLTPDSVRDFNYGARRRFVVIVRDWLRRSNPRSNPLFFVHTLIVAHVNCSPQN